MSDYLTKDDIAYLIHRTPQTVKQWIRWSETDGKNHPELYLPPAQRIAKNKGRAWQKADLKYFKKFGKLIGDKWSGAMSEWNAKKVWGKRGKRILERKKIPLDK